MSLLSSLRKLQKVTSFDMFILYGFAMEVSCWVMTIVLRPMCLPLKASLTSSLVLFFTSLEAAQSSSITRLLVLFCEFNDISKNTFHFDVIARYREYVGVFQVLPVLVRLVILERRTHDEDVVKMVLIFFFQHFQEVVCFSTGRHAGDDHVKWCIHFLVLGGAIKFGPHDVNYSVGNHEDVAGQVRRRSFFFYLQ